MHVASWRWRNGACVLMEVSADLPAALIKVEGLPEDAGMAMRRVGEITHWPSGRIQGREGQKVLLRQLARRVDPSLTAGVGQKQSPARPRGCRAAGFALPIGERVSAA